MVEFLSPEIHSGLTQKSKMKMLKILKKNLPCASANAEQLGGVKPQKWG
jgi:hypothetical protein